MRNKAIGACFLLVMFIFSACTNVEGPQTKGETTTSTNQPKQIETSKPNTVEVQDFTSDCSRVVIPSNVELDTSLNKETGLLTVRWYDNSKGKDVGVVFRYSEQNCSESAKQLIQHVLTTEEYQSSLKLKDSSEARSSCKTAPKTLNWNGKEYVLKTENTSLEPVMKLGFLKCSNGKFIVAEDEDNNSYTVRGVGNPTNNKDIIILGNWGRALYSPVKEEATKEVEDQYPYFVSSLLNGKYSFKYEIIANNIKNDPNTTVVFSEGYKDIPDNTDFQKLFLLLLVDQLGEDVKTKRIEFWSNKEHALAYVTGNYEKDGIEGWSGMNSRFGLLMRDGQKISLSHILSVHERDIISFGKYKNQ